MSGEARREEIFLPDGGSATIRVRRSRRARRVGLRVDVRDGVVELVLPASAALRDGLAFARGQNGWIAARLGGMAPPAPFADGAAFPLLGRTVVIRRDPGAAAPPVLAGGLLIVGGAEDVLPGRVRRWIAARALGEIAPRARAMAAVVGRPPGKISVRDTRSRWGSCTREGRLAFSWRLVMAPEFVLDYVVAHEVAHLRHLDHGARFRKLVAELHPGCEAAETWLRERGPDLHRYGRGGPS